MNQGTLQLLICLGAIVAVVLIWGIESSIATWANRNRPPRDDDES
jgi:hypothetical protein